ncbi:MAG: hypothetical protein WBD36_05495 [Bacteroidota bacterium]
MRPLVYGGILFFLASSLMLPEMMAQERSSDSLIVPSGRSTKTKPKTIKKRRTIYRIQSESVAQEVGLSADQTAKLEVLYREMRKSHKLALSKIPREGDKEVAASKIQELRQKDREKFAAHLDSVVTTEQRERILPLLCCFNPQWDTFTNVLAGFKLGREKMAAAMAVVNGYVLELSKSKEIEMSSGVKGMGRSVNASRNGLKTRDSEKSHEKNVKSRSSSNRSKRESPQTMRDRLDSRLGQILTAEEYVLWKESSKKRKQN